MFYYQSFAILFIVMLCNGTVYPQHKKPLHPAWSNQQIQEQKPEHSSRMGMEALFSECIPNYDKALNNIYQKVIKLAQTTCSKETVEDIRKAQRRWIAYRDAYTDALGDYNGFAALEAGLYWGGRSEFVLNAKICFIQNRIKQLFKIHDVLNKQWSDQLDESAEYSFDTQAKNTSEGKANNKNLSVAQLTEKLSKAYTSLDLSITQTKLDSDIDDDPASYARILENLKDTQRSIKKSLPRLKKCEEEFFKQEFQVFEQFLSNDDLTETQIDILKKWWLIEAINLFPSEVIVF